MRDWKTETATIDGETHSLVEWCMIRHVTVNSIRVRMSRDCISFEEALEKNVPKRWTDRYATIDGETRTMEEWLDVFGLPKYVVQGRMTKMGMTFEEALKFKTSKNKRAMLIECNGETHTAFEWSKILNTSIDTIYARIRRGMPPTVAVSSPSASELRFDAQPEIIAMCERCPYNDCVSDARSCKERFDEWRKVNG